MEKKKDKVNSCSGIMNTKRFESLPISESTLEAIKEMKLQCLTQAWNIQTQAELNFTDPIGQVYAMVMDNGVLFAGHR
ncbi:hypothetical protein Acr_00g0024700 [Actinidia rufa]|uniref:Uncharacterized protein n=1 Tax=Actinidia rufa TaxID=165716 RepID=A0A7J0DDG7_9ERIC|nr:hypothetical protein Acr_00g0024700 [Actinidia rufa]